MNDSPSTSPVKNRRNRRSRKKGSSWTARSKRLRALLDVDVAVQALEHRARSDFTFPPSVPDHLPTNFNNDADGGVQDQTGLNNISVRIQKRVNVITKEVLLGIMSLYGPCAFTVRQYEFFLSVMDFASHNCSLPSASSIRKVKWPYLIQHNFPKSTVVPFSLQARFATPRTTNEVENTGKVVIVPISEWAKRDVSNSILRDELLHNQRRGPLYQSSDELTERTIERSDLLLTPASSPSHEDGLFISKENYMHRADRHDIINFDCSMSTLGPIPSSFVPPLTQSPTLTSTHVQARVGFTYCPGAAGSTKPDNSDFKSDYISVDQSCLSSNERLLLRYLKVSMSTRSRVEDTASQHDFPILPGDVCTILLPITGDDEAITTFGLLCNRFWRTEEEPASQFFVTFTCCLHNPSSCDINVVSKSEVLDTPTWSRRTNSTQHQPTHQERPIFGTLQDGRQYFVYRVLLYCDDFLPRSGLFPKGSVGGCCFVPLSFSLKRRRGGAAIRTISLTPSGISTNYVLDYIIDDIVTATTHGIDATDSDGRPVTIFIDVVGFIGDYPESSKVCDILSHAARAPCTVCSFRHRTLIDSARFAYSISIHSSHSSFGRTLRKTLALRSSDISADDLNLLGMKAGNISSIEEPGRWPLLKLACKLDSIKHLIPLTVDNEPVVSGIFDPYARNVIAPDHLLAGLGKFLIDTIFKTIDNEASRRKLDIVICRDLQDLGFGSHTMLYNSTTRRLNSVSMSTIYGILLVIVPEMRNVGAFNVEIQNLTLKYTRLVALTFWWPLPGTDSLEDFNFVHADDQRTYHSTMADLASEVVQLIANLYSNSNVAATDLDRPNTHRLLELYRHTIPRLSHALFCCDMSFEHNHQPLKSSLLRNTNPTCHLTAVYNILGTDWFGRLSELVAHQAATSVDAKEKQSGILRSLRRLLFGDLVDEINEETVGSTVFIQVLRELDDHVQDVLDPAFSELLLKWYGSYITSWERGNWSGFKRNSTAGETRRCFRRGPYNMAIETDPSALCESSTLQSSQQKLKNYLNERALHKYVHVCEKAFYEQRFGRLKRRRYTQHTIHPGEFFECFLPVYFDRSDIVTPTCSGEGSHSVFRIQALLASSDKVNSLDSNNTVWALAVRGHLQDAGKHIYVFNEITSPEQFIVQLSGSVRKCWGLHACHLATGCSVDVGNKKISHTVGSTSTFYMLLRRNGFPPRRS